MAKRWNKRHPDERRKIVRNTFARIQRRVDKLWEVDEAEHAQILDEIAAEATVLSSRLRFAPNSQKERLGRLLDDAAHASSTERMLTKLCPEPPWRTTE